MDAIQEITHSQTPTEGNSPPQDVVDGQAENGSTINMNLADNNAEIQVPAEEHAEISGVSEASHTSTENMELNQTELNVVTPIEVHFTMTALQALAGAVDPYAQSTIMPQLLAHINASSSPELQSLLAEVIAARARRAPVTPHSSAAVRRFIGSLPEVLDLEEGDDCRVRLFDSLIAFFVALLGLHDMSWRLSLEIHVLQLNAYP